MRPLTACCAEPDLDAAAHAMRTVASNPCAAAELGESARAYIASGFSVDAKVDFVRARLHELRSNR